VDDEENHRKDEKQVNERAGNMENDEGPNPREE
jgi:hypothetical protein